MINNLINGNTNIDSNKEINKSNNENNSKNNGVSFLDMANEKSKSINNDTNNVSTTSTSEITNNIYIDINENTLYVGKNDSGDKYAMEYTEYSSKDYPQIKVTGEYSDGTPFAEVININTIDLYNASVLEIKAFEIHLSEIGYLDNLERMGVSFPDLSSAGLGEKFNLMDLINNDTSYTGGNDVASTDLGYGDLSSMFQDSSDAIMELIDTLLGMGKDEEASELEKLYLQQQMLLGIQL